MSFKILDSYTTCSVWLTFCIVVKKVQWSCTLKFLERRNICIEGTCCFIFLQIRSNILAKENVICENKAIHSLMRFGLIIIFSPWHLLLTKGFHFFKKNCHEDKIIPEIENTILADIQYMNKYKTFLMKWSLTIISCITFALKGRIPLLKNDVCFFSCFNHMEGILHTCSHISFQNKYTSTSYFLYYCRMFQSINSQPCQGT